MLRFAFVCTPDFTTRARFLLVSARYHTHTLARSGLRCRVSGVVHFLRTVRLRCSRLHFLLTRLPGIHTAGSINGMGRCARTHALRIIFCF